MKHEPTGCSAQFIFRCFEYYLKAHLNLHQPDGWFVGQQFYAKQLLLQTAEFVKGVFNCFLFDHVGFRFCYSRKTIIFVYCAMKKIVTYFLGIVTVVIVLYYIQRRCVWKTQTTSGSNLKGTKFYHLNIHFLWSDMFILNC